MYISAAINSSGSQKENRWPDRKNFEKRGDYELKTD